MNFTRPLAPRARAPARAPAVARRVVPRATPTGAPPAPAITLTPAALAQCRALAAKRGDGADLVLRVGVKSGGCNGMR